MHSTRLHTLANCRRTGRTISEEKPDDLNIEFTDDVNDMKWPEHCVQGTKGAEFHPDLDVRATLYFLSPPPFTSQRRRHTITL